ncbi:MAG: hypothetical protein RL707_1888 [Pseudomonadota bacterium]
MRQSPCCAPLRFGRLVTDFFKRIADLHISVTTIRAVIATGAASLLGNDIITIEEHEGVSYTSGHSGATVLKYYKKQDRKRDMANATEVHRKLLKPAHLDCEPFMRRSSSPIDIGDEPLNSSIATG